MRDGFTGIVVAALVIALAGCGDDPTEIRIQNASEVALDSTIVGFPSQREIYGRLEPGQASDYRAVAEAYRYARIDAYFSGQRGVIQPIDYVGEEPLDSGRYTYRLTVNPAGESELNRVSLEFVED